MCQLYLGAVEARVAPSPPRVGSWSVGQGVAMGGGYYDATGHLGDRVSAPFPFCLYLPPLPLIIVWGYRLWLWAYGLNLV